MAKADLFVLISGVPAGILSQNQFLSFQRPITQNCIFVNFE